MEKENSSTCGIYLFDKNTQKILVCHATKSQRNVWSIPKGLKDEGENCYDAACRELLEETGIDVNSLNIIFLAALKPVPYKKQKKTLYSYLMVTDSILSGHTFHCESVTKQGYPEIDGWKWIRPYELPTSVHESQQVNYASIIKLLASPGTKE